MAGNTDDKDAVPVQLSEHVNNQLPAEILPGTEIMTDSGNHQSVNGKTKKVLVPRPNVDDPHDPLNWSASWKAACMTTCTLATFIQAFGPLSLAPIFGPITEEFHCTLAQAVQFTGVSILVLGFSNFIWVPMSASFGRRPVLIISQLINFAANIWRARAKTYASFMGACVINGIGSGPAEMIQPSVIADIFFLHDRGKWNTVYWFFSMGAVMVGPIVSGAMSLHVGWRNFWWLNTALLGFSFITIVFLFPETKYRRDYQQESPAESVGEIGFTEPASDKNEEAATAHDPYLGRGTPSRRQWSLFQPSENPLKDISRNLLIPWKLFAFPIVQFASFVVSWSCSSFLMVNLTQSQAFAAPPYNFSTQTIGFMNFAMLIGAFIGLATGGPLSDWVSARATNKNNGIREPEMRLPAMIPYIFIMYLGNIILSVGYQNHWPWEAIVIIGFTCAGIQTAALPSIVSTYAIDSYKPVADSLFLSITINKNLWGYGLSLFITPWVEKAGFIPPVMTNASLILLWCLFGVIFYWKGKTFRRWSRNSQVHRV